MKIISWNVRGVGRRSKRRLIKEKLVNSKADVVILQETKKAEFQRKLIGSIWGVRYTDWVSIPSNGSSGGILVMWKTKSVSVMEAVIGNFSVSIKIQAINGRGWWLSGVYGPNKTREREEFWEELAGLYGLCGPRWCVGGDFNVVRFPSEKSSGGRMTRSMRAFNNFLQDTNMRDPNLLNAEFT
jgi:exonuclease III